MAYSKVILWAPLLCAAGVQPMAAGLLISPVDFISFYLDNNNLIGSIDSIIIALE